MHVMSSTRVHQVCAGVRETLGSNPILHECSLHLDMASMYIIFFIGVTRPIYNNGTTLCHFKITC